MIESVLGTGARYGLAITYSHERPEALETGGGIFNALPLLGSAPFLLVNGDVWTDIDFGALRRDPPERSLAHLVMVRNPPQHARGDFVLADGLVSEGEGSRQTYSGVGIYRPEFFAGCEPGKFPLLPLLRRAIAQRALSGELHEGRWYDIGTTERLAALERSCRRPRFLRENEMKKIVIVVVVLVIALVVAPWGVGKMAETRLNQGLDKLVEAAPYLKITDRKWTRGWFKSESLVTFEIAGPWADLMSPKAFEKAMSEAAAGPESESEAASEPRASRGARIAGRRSPAGGSAGRRFTEETEADAAKDEPTRFTVRNEVLHGPVLGLSGFGIARVDSHLVLDDQTRKKITEIFGPKDPLEVSTRIRFFGGGTTTLKSEGRKITPKGGKADISWDTFKVAMGYSRNFDSYDLDGKWPKFEVKDAEDGTHFVMDSMSLDGDGKRVRGDLYDGDFTFKIEKLSVAGKGQDQIEVR